MPIIVLFADRGAGGGLGGEAPVATAEPIAGGGRGGPAPGGPGGWGGAAPRGGGGGAAGPAWAAGDGTKNECPHLGQRIFKPAGGTRRSSI
jgi:hypothetical protein